MFYIMPESQGNIMGLRATGKLTDQDYQEVLLPSLENLLKQHRKIRLLCFLDENFAGLEPEALWEDAKFFFPHTSSIPWKNSIAIPGSGYPRPKPKKDWRNTSITRSRKRGRKTELFLQLYGVSCIGMIVGTLVMRRFDDGSSHRRDGVFLLKVKDLLDI